MSVFADPLNVNQQQITANITDFTDLCGQNIYDLKV